MPAKCISHERGETIEKSDEGPERFQRQDKQRCLYTETDGLEKRFYEKGI